MNGSVASEAGLPDVVLPETIVDARDGAVLLKGTILKSDHFPGCQNTKLTPQVEGCPNFRQIRGLPVFGVAIPTAQGLRNMLEKLARDLPAGTTIHWHNMREEPLIYISGRPFVVREGKNPFMNLEYTGIPVERVEEMEERLRADILREATQYQQQILVADEDDAFNVFNTFQRVTEQDVLTPKTMFEELRNDGYNVQYSRIPITDEKGPKPEDFDRLVNIVYSAKQPAAFVFNCQMGRGRTTTGMVIASLVLLKKNHMLEAAPDGETRSGASAAMEEDHSHFTAPGWFQEGIERSLASEATAISADPSDSTALMSAGHLLVVRSLLRVLPRGTFAKAALDAVIDACSAMQNLRSVIVRYRANMLKEPREDRRARILNVCTDHIDRYCHLIVFAAYLGSSKGPGGIAFQPYEAFLGSLPEIQSVLGRLLRAFPLLTLELDADSFQDKPVGEERTLVSEGVRERRGRLLTASTILKADNYPSLLSPAIPQPLTGATNFRQAEHSLPVFGAGISTLQGIQRALQLIGCGPTGIPSVDAAWSSSTASSDATQKIELPADGRRVAIWHNLREEPLLYINGTPYVLRETSGAYKNMLEYGGIDGPRLERMEEDLKQEVLQEAERLGGKVNVLYEEMTGVEHRSKGHRVKLRGRLMTGFELVLDKSAVQTPRQMYASLARAGYCVVYRRVPITDGKCPGHDDISAIHESLVSAPSGKSCFVFNCQQGKGRTTIGMVMASLFLTSPVWLESKRFGVPEETAFAVSSLQRARITSHPETPNILTALEHKNGQMTLKRAETDSADGDSDMDSCRSPTHTTPHSGPARCSDGSPQHPSPGDRPPMESQQSLEMQGSTPCIVPSSFLGVRRLLAEIVDSAAIVSWLECALESCSHMVNLRQVIGSHRRGPMPSSQMRPEFSRLRQAFERDAVALARYCLLTTYTAYLHHMGPKVGAGAVPSTSDAGHVAVKKSFKDWLSGLHSVQVALAAPLDDPIQALTPILPAFPPRSNSTTPFNCVEHAVPPNGSVPAAVVQHVLATRRFRMLTPHTILKSFHQSNLPMQPQKDLLPPALTGGEPLPDVLDIRHVPGKPICLVSNPSVQGLRALVERLGAKGRKKVVLLDTREELCVYLAGHPYTRRDIEMPTASLHHAGIHWHELKRKEEWLLEDVRLSSGNWMEDNAHRVLVHKEVVGPTTRITEDATDATLQSITTTPLTAHWLSIPQDSVTSVDSGIASVWEVVSSIAKGGASLWYRRMPLSRNRTPSHQDLSELHEGAFCADGSTENVQYVIIARAAASSTSACFAAHFMCVVLDAVQDHEGRRSNAGSMAAVNKAARTNNAAAAYDKLEISAIDNLCRLLPTSTREQVDCAIQQLKGENGDMQDILDCIIACKEKLRALQSSRISTDDVQAVTIKVQQVSTAKRLGAHYLMRYFLLVAFRAFLQTWLEDRATGRGGDGTFSSWFERHAEMDHLLRECMYL